MTDEIRNLTPQEIEQARELLSPYLDGEVTEAERALVERTLAQSAEMQRELASLRQTVRLFNEMPRLSTPRPFTLSEADVGFVGREPSFWQRLNLVPVLGGLAALVALVVCGAFILFRGVGPATAPQAVSLAPEAANEVTAPREQAAAQPTGPAEAGAALQEEPASDEDATEVTVVEKEVEAETAVEEAQSAPAPAEAPLGEAGALSAEDRAEGAPPPPPLPTPAPTPVAPLSPPATAMGEGAQPPQFTLEEQQLRFEPGQIRISGRLLLPDGAPLPENAPLRITFWRDDEPFDWAEPDTLQAVVGPDGALKVVIRARPDRADADLFADTPADYLIRLESKDPAYPGLALVPFDTFGPPP